MPTASATAGYSVAAPLEPLGWVYADRTQRMANDLPAHSKIRKLKHSNGQTFINAVYGKPLEDFEERVELALRSRFAATAPLDELDVCARAEIPEWVRLDDPTVRVNHVRNSSFEIWTVPGKLPDGWAKSGTAEVVAGLEGRNALRLTVAAGMQTTVFQDVTVRIRANEPFTASCWCAVSTNALTAPAADFGLVVTATHVDGTTTAVEGLFPATTDGAWRRETLALSFPKETVAVRIGATVKDLPASFSFVGETLDVDCFQLEPGGKASPWRPDILDVLPWAKNERRIAMFLAGAETAHYVDNLEDFWERSVPTRAALVRTESGSYAAATTAGSVEVTDYHKATWRFLFESTGTALRKRGEDVPDDAFPDKAIRVRDVDGEFVQIENPVIEAITFFAGRLWVVLQEPDPNGVFVRTLHVLEPRSPHPEPAYLESIGGIRVPTDVPLAAAIHRVEFLDEDRQHVYLATATTRYAVRLYYDLFTVDPESRLLFLRENYASVIPL